MLKPSVRKMTFILLLRESSSTLNFFTHIPDYMFAITNVWLVMAETKKNGNLFLPVDSKFFTFQIQQNEVLIQEIYNIDIGKEQTVKKFGSWKKDDISNFLEIDPITIVECRKDMEGLIFQGETMVESPFVNGNDADILSGKQTKLGGTWGEVWHRVEQIMNFSTKIVPGMELLILCIKIEHNSE